MLGYHSILSLGGEGNGPGTLRVVSPCVVVSPGTSNPWKVETMSFSAVYTQLPFLGKW